MDLSVNEVAADDEGYTSPIEEDFRYNPIPFGIKQVTVLDEPNEINRLQEHFQDDERIPWEDVAKLPYIPNRHLSWDNLQVPIPFRFQASHAVLLKKTTKPPPVPFLSDCMTKSVQFVDSLWRIPNVLDDSYSGEGRPVIDFVKNSAVEELKQSLQKPIYISLKQFIQHAFHLLSGRESQTFLLDEKSKETFRKNPVILIHGISPTGLYSYCKSLLKCGSIVKRLNRYSALHYDNKLLKEEGLDKNAVVAALRRYIADYLKLYQTILMLNSSNVSTLTNLISFIKPFRHQLETLEYVLDNSPYGNAVDLISCLNFLLFLNETPFISDLIRGLFITCASAYLKYVSNWIFRGSLGPPSEFHIEKLRCTPYRDRRFWTKQFSHKNVVPMFLEDSVDVIFETGKAINLLNQIQNENIFACIPLFCYDTDVLLTPELEFEDVATLYNVWKQKLDAFLKEQAYLTDGISLSIEQVLTSQEQGIDFEAIENARIEREKIILTRKLGEYQCQKAKKKEFLEILQEQIDESKARKLKETQKSKMEDDVNNEYWVTKDKRDLIEEKRHRMKHFGDEDLTSNQNRNKGTYWRLHSAPTGTSSSSSDVGNLEKIGILESVDMDTLGPLSKKVAEKKEIAPFFPIRDPKIDNDSSDQIDNANCEVNLLNLEALVENSSEILEEDIEYNDEKFNPDKIITKSPPPYKTSVSLDSALSQISLLEFARTKEDQRMKTNQEFALSCRYDPYCLSEFLSQSIAIPLNAQNRMVNSAVLHYFVCEKNLFFHVEALNNFLCLQNGLFGHVLSTLLIQEVNLKNMRTREDVVSKSGRLSMILIEALSTAVENEEHNEFVRNLGFTINKDIDQQTGDANKTVGSSTGSFTRERSISSDYEILDTVRLCYSVEWPLNILLTEDILHHYEKLFVFLMQLFRAELLLQRAYTMLKCKNAKSPQLFTLHQYRYRLLHFVTTVRNYVNVTVIHSAWTELCSAFTKMDSLEKIYEYLVRHIKTVNTNCLLGAKAGGVMKLLTNQLVIIETFCSQLDRVAANIEWAKGEEIPAKDFKKLVQKFKAIEEIGKVFTDVAYKLVNKGYYPKVSYFLELYNFNGYFQMKETSG